MPFKNKSVQLQYFRRYNRARAESRKAYDKQYQLAHRDELNTYYRAYNANRRDKWKFVKLYADDPVYRNSRLEYNRQWRQEHKIELKASKQKSHYKHRDANNAKSRRYYREHREEMILKVKEYDKLNPHIRFKRHQNRQLRKSIGQPDHAAIAVFIKRVKSLQLVHCYYCKSVIFSSGCHFDHIIPLSRFGAHSSANLCVACSHCNLTKHAKIPSEFITFGQLIFDI